MAHAQRIVILVFILVLGACNGSSPETSATPAPSPKSAPPTKPSKPSTRVLTAAEVREALPKDAPGFTPYVDSASPSATPTSAARETVSPTRCRQFWEDGVHTADTGPSVPEVSDNAYFTAEASPETLWIGVESWADEARASAKMRLLRQLPRCRRVSLSDSSGAKPLVYSVTSAPVPALGETRIGLATSAPLSGTKSELTDTRWYFQLGHNVITVRYGYWTIIQGAPPPPTTTMRTLVAGLLQRLGT